MDFITINNIKINESIKFNLNVKLILNALLSGSVLFCIPHAYSNNIPSTKQKVSAELGLDSKKEPKSKKAHLKKIEKR